MKLPLFPVVSSFDTEFGRVDHLSSYFSNLCQEFHEARSHGHTAAAYSP
uniref:Uncharacterized protein n=1 Tax=Arundo donax TaxID=35708 RepID=A0A0A8XZG0_ARUDO